MPVPEVGDWLDEHREKGQTFRQYLSARPIRRDASHRSIALCLVGHLSEAHERILAETRTWLSLFFDVPVELRRRVSYEDIPADAKRKHPHDGHKQLLTSYILHQILEPDIPEDALAYLAFTARDLYPADDWNFVFGQASLRKRVGVWSIYRNGWPTGEGYRLCLRRTLRIAAHETGHILTMAHCIAHRCLMNGSNSREESDSQPLYPCPMCLRKLCWNLQVTPKVWLARLAAFCEERELEDRRWFGEAVRLLASDA